MTKVTIERELLERVIGEGAGTSLTALRELRAILSAPRQPEGEGLEVVGLQWLDSGHYRKKPPKYGFNPHDWNELCRLSDAQRAIAELREECERLRAVLDGAEYPNIDRLKALSVETCREVGRTVGSMTKALQAERDTLRQQLAERDAEIERLRGRLEKAWLEGDRLAMQGFELQQAIAQRDKLAGLLAKTQEELDPHRHAVLWGEICDALAEVNPCPESPAPTT